MVGVSILALAGAPFGQCLRAVCPEHDDAVASLAIYSDHLHCYGCRFHVSRVFEALSYLLWREQSRWKEAMRLVREGRVPEPARWAVQPVIQRAARATAHRAALTERDILRYHAALMGRPRAWLHARGLSDTTIARARLGYTGAAYVIPVYRDGTLTSVRYRRDDAVAPDRPKYLSQPGSRVSLYPWWVPEQPDVIVIAEGEFDVLLLWQCGLPAVTTTGGAGSLSLVLPVARRARRVLIATDQDRAGDDAAALLQAACRQAVRLRWQGAKDVSEAYVRFGSAFLDFLVEAAFTSEKEVWFHGTSSTI